MAKNAANKSRAIKRRPATSPEERENQLISLAFDTVEKRIREGIATSGELVAILKMGSIKERLEKEKLQRENELLVAKVGNLESLRREEGMYEEVLRALRLYQGKAVEEDYYDD